jgi:hypothetical protein
MNTVRMLFSKKKHSKDARPKRYYMHSRPDPINTDFHIYELISHMHACSMIINLIFLRKNNFINHPCICVTGILGEKNKIPAQELFYPDLV